MDWYKLHNPFYKYSIEIQSQINKGYIKTQLHKKKYKTGQIRKVNFEEIYSWSRDVKMASIQELPHYDVEVLRNNFVICKGDKQPSKTYGDQYNVNSCYL